MPNEVYVFNRELSDAALDVLEQQPELFQPHARLVPEVGKFIAIVAAQVTVFGDLHHKLRRGADREGGGLPRLCWRRLRYGAAMVRNRSTSFCRAIVTDRTAYVAV